jgi:hypothetical protein
MSLAPASVVEKYCLAYCGDDRCNCQAKPRLDGLLADFREYLAKDPDPEELARPRFLPSRIGRSE